MQIIIVIMHATISIHALLAESDSNHCQAITVAHHISIHALLAESDSIKRYQIDGSIEFLSTLSLRRATHQTYQPQQLAISIHALLAESDSIIDIINNVVNNFYPRSPCGERQLGRAVAV